MPAVGTVSRAPTGPLSIDTRNRGEGLLIDTMQLVEPRKSQYVPNHLLETKIFSKVAQNSVVQARPANVHFSGFDVEKKHVQKLSIVNASMDVIRLHIIPPQTKYFYLKYTKKEKMVPGLSLDCTIEFNPDEFRYYYDSIRVHCPGEDNLVIPIHAYPVMDTSSFPSHFTFSPVPVGHKMTKIIPLRCDAPVDFEYHISYLQPHPSFAIEPMSGVVPAHGESEINVTFAPSEFLTANAIIQLVISQFQSTPFVCNITGTSIPGLLKDKTLGAVPNETKEYSDILDPRCLSPVDRSRKKKKKLPSAGTVKTPVVEEIEYKGIKFPVAIDTPYAVAQVLNQEPGKLRAKDLREAVLVKNASTSAPSTRQMKEARFEHAVRQNVYEERQNQLRWQKKLGEDQMSVKAKCDILDEREQSSNEYRFNRCGEPIPENEFQRSYTNCAYQRTIRDSLKLAAEGVKFDTYSNDMWSVRHSALSTFVQAARKVIIRTRASERLKSLRKVVDDWHQKKFKTETLTVEQQEKLDMGDENVFDSDLSFSAVKVKRYQFPTYAPPNVKDDMAPDALGIVPYKPTEVIVKKKVPFFKLKVPQQYNLMGYSSHDVHTASSGYVPPKLVKPLRTGAEEEIISLPLAAGDSSPVVPVDEGDLHLMDYDEVQTVQQEIKPTSLTPPDALFKSIEYPSLHIFNPAPGLQVFQSPVPYAEVDPDFHLCPLPRYFPKHNSNQHTSTQRRYLDREDVIRGVMAWKKFPSQGLTSLSSIPTLTNVWVPRWDDPFGTDILPEDTPVLFDTLADDDQQNIIEEEETEEAKDDTVDVSLTPDMVNSQFQMIDISAPIPADEKPSGDQLATKAGNMIEQINVLEQNNASDNFPNGNRLPSTNIPVSYYGPIPREKREEELEYFITKKYNRLGGKIQNKTNSLNNALTDEKLILK